MVKQSAEGKPTVPLLVRGVFIFSFTVLERIMQNGKKKLVLDHLIVQKMDDDQDEDVKSILMFGAQALFEEGADQSDKEIHCKCPILSLRLSAHGRPRFRA